MRPDIRESSENWVVKMQNKYAALNAHFILCIVNTGVYTVFSIGWTCTTLFTILNQQRSALNLLFCSNCSGLFALCILRYAFNTHRGLNVFQKSRNKPLNCLRLGLSQVPNICY